MKLITQVLIQGVHTLAGSSARMLPEGDILSKVAVLCERNNIDCPSNQDILAMWNALNKQPLKYQNLGIV